MATIKYIFYFCGVKLTVRYEAAAIKQRFLCPQCISKNKRKEWGRSNRPEVKCISSVNLTAPTALSFINV
jgi:hypothetical protein